MGVHSFEKKQLSAKGMLTEVRRVLKKIPEPQRDPRGLKGSISLPDCLMSGLSLFSLKIPSLLQFDQGLADEVIIHNLKTLYGIERVPSDTYLRERLDKVDPPHFDLLFQLFSHLYKGAR
jgi:hypothetical protein